MPSSACKSHFLLSTSRAQLGYTNKFQVWARARLEFWVCHQAELSKPSSNLSTWASLVHPELHSNSAQNSSGTIYQIFRFYNDHRYNISELSTTNLLKPVIKTQQLYYVAQGLTSVASNVFKALALWADAFYKSKCPYVCVCVCVCVHFWGTV